MKCAEYSVIYLQCLFYIQIHYDLFCRIFELKIEKQMRINIGLTMNNKDINGFFFKSFQCYFCHSSIFDANTD